MPIALFISPSPRITMFADCVKFARRQIGVLQHPGQAGAAGPGLHRSRQGGLGPGGGLQVSEGLQVVDPPGDAVLGAQAPPQPGVGRDRQGQALGAQPGLVDAGRDGSGQFGQSV